MPTRYKRDFAVKIWKMEDIVNNIEFDFNCFFKEQTNEYIFMVISLLKKYELLDEDKAPINAGRNRLIDVLTELYASDNNAKKFLMEVYDVGHKNYNHKNCIIEELAHIGIEKTMKSMREGGNDEKRNATTDLFSISKPFTSFLYSLIMLSVEMHKRDKDYGAISALLVIFLAFLTGMYQKSNENISTEINKLRKQNRSLTQELDAEHAKTDKSSLNDGLKEKEYLSLQSLTEQLARKDLELSKLNEQLIKANTSVPEYIQIELDKNRVAIENLRMENRTRTEKLKKMEMQEKINVQQESYVANMLNKYLNRFGTTDEIRSILVQHGFRSADEIELYSIAESKNSQTEGCVAAPVDDMSHATHTSDSNTIVVNNRDKYSTTFDRRNGDISSRKIGYISIENGIEYVVFPNGKKSKIRLGNKVDLVSNKQFVLVNNEDQIVWRYNWYHEYSAQDKQIEKYVSVCSDNNRYYYNCGSYKYFDVFNMNEQYFEENAVVGIDKDSNVLTYYKHVALELSRYMDSIHINRCVAYLVISIHSDEYFIKNVETQKEESKKLINLTDREIRENSVVIVNESNIIKIVLPYSFYAKSPFFLHRKELGTATDTETKEKSIVVSSKSENTAVCCERPTENVSMQKVNTKKFKNVMIIGDSLYSDILNQKMEQAGFHSKMLHGFSKTSDIAEAAKDVDITVVLARDISNENLSLIRKVMRQNILITNEPRFDTIVEQTKQRIEELKKLW